MTIYTPQIKTVQAKLKAKGRVIVVRHKSPKTINPILDTPKTLDDAEAKVYALVTPPTTMTEQAYASQFADGTMVRSRTRNVLMSAQDTSGTMLGFELREGDELDFDGYTWSVVGASFLAPDGTPIFWKTTCKR